MLESQRNLMILSRNPELYPKQILLFSYCFIVSRIFYLMEFCFKKTRGKGDARGWLRHISNLFHLVTLVAGRAQCSNVLQCILLSSQLPLPLKHSELITCALDLNILLFYLKDSDYHLGP